MALKAEIQVLPNFGLKEGDLAWATAMYAKKYLEKWGVQVVVVRGEHEDPSIKTRVQRAVDANACAIISLHYNAGLHLQRAQRYLFLIR